MTTSTRTTPDTQGFGRLAAALAPPSGAGARLETRLAALTLAIRWITIVAGIVIGLAKPPTQHLFVAAAGLIAVAVVQTARGLRGAALQRAKTSSVIELVVAVGAIAITGGIKSPFILTPVTGLLLAGYVWGRRATIGTAVAGAIAAAATIVIQVVDSVDRAQSSQIALVFLLCGALGAFTRNLVVEMETQRAAAIDQAAQMATANDLLISLHRLAQTLPASFDLGEVVESIRQRLRALFPFTALVVLVPDDDGAIWRTELTEGVRHRGPVRRVRAAQTAAPRHANPRPGGRRRPVGPRRRRRLRGLRPQRPLHRHCGRGEPSSAWSRSSTNRPTCTAPPNSELLESLSSVLALSLDNARWFGRLHTLGAEAERGRIARELHDRVAQSLAYVTFELERLSVVPGDKGQELENLHSVVRDIMQELRETIYQLRASVTEEHQLSDVAPRLPRAFPTANRHQDRVAGVLAAPPPVSGRAGTVADRAGSAGQRRTAFRCFPRARLLGRR